MSISNKHKTLFLLAFVALLPLLFFLLLVLRSPENDQNKEPAVHPQTWVDSTQVTHK